MRGGGSGRGPRMSDGQWPDIRAMSRAQYVAFLVAQAPEITAEDWDATVAVLRVLRCVRRAGEGGSPARPRPGRSGA